MTPGFSRWAGGASLCAFLPANHRTRCSAVRATARGPGRRGDYHLAPTSGDNLIVMSAPTTLTATYPLCEPHVTRTPHSTHSEPKEPFLFLHGGGRDLLFPNVPFQLMLPLSPSQSAQAQHACIAHNRFVFKSSRNRPPTLHHPQQVTRR